MTVQDVRDINDMQTASVNSETSNGVAGICYDMKPENSLHPRKNLRICRDMLKGSAQLTKHIPDFDDERIRCIRVRSDSHNTSLDSTLNLQRFQDADYIKKEIECRSNSAHSEIIESDCTRNPHYAISSCEDQSSSDAHVVDKSLSKMLSQCVEKSSGEIFSEDESDYSFPPLEEVAISFDFDGKQSKSQDEVEILPDNFISDDLCIVSLTVYVPYYQNVDIIAASNNVRCQVLILPCNVASSVDQLHKYAISKRTLDKLPSLINNFEVPSNVLVVLEFYHRNSSKSKEYVCQGRVYVPSLLFHLIAKKDLTMPPEKDDRLEQIVKDIGRHMICISLPLDLCHPDAPPPCDIMSAESQLLQIADKLRTGFESEGPVIRFRIKAEAFENSCAAAALSSSSPERLQRPQNDLLTDINHSSSGQRNFSSGQRTTNSTVIERPFVPRLGFLPSPDADVTQSSNSRQFEEPLCQACHRKIPDERQSARPKCVTSHRSPRLSELPPTYNLSHRSHRFGSKSSRYPAPNQQRLPPYQRRQQHSNDDLSEEELRQASRFRAKTHRQASLICKKCLAHSTDKCSCRKALDEFSASRSRQCKTFRMPSVREKYAYDSDLNDFYPFEVHHQSSTCRPHACRKALEESYRIRQCKTCRIPSIREKYLHELELNHICPNKEYRESSNCKHFCSHSSSGRSARHGFENAEIKLPLKCLPSPRKAYTCFPRCTRQRTNAIELGPTAHNIQTDASTVTGPRSDESTSSTPYQSQSNNSHWSLSKRLSSEKVNSGSYELFRYHYLKNLCSRRNPLWLRLGSNPKWVNLQRVSKPIKLFRQVRGVIFDVSSHNDNSPINTPSTAHSTTASSTPQSNLEYLNSRNNGPQKWFQKVRRQISCSTPEDGSLCSSSSKAETSNCVRPLMGSSVCPSNSFSDLASLVGRILQWLAGFCRAEMERVFVK